MGWGDVKLKQAADGEEFLEFNERQTKTRTESLQTKDWFKVSPVGINKLNSLMNSMAQKAGINNERLQNHSSRKTMIQTLSENDIPPTHIAQLSGHKNLKSIEN